MPASPSAQRPGWPALLLAGWLLGVSVPLVVGQGLAFVGLFRVGFVLALSLALLPGAAWAYARAGLPPAAAPTRGAPWAWLLPAALLWALVVYPVLLWPRTPLGGFMGGAMAWDVVYYHLPKATDLVQRGHFWNLALPYAQYPNGWEGLLALSVGLGRSAEGLGPASGVALLGLLLAATVLLQRLGRWPGVLAGLVVGGMFFSFYLPVPNNPWRELGRVVHYASGVGKNDLFAAALVLAAWAHLPWGLGEPAARPHPWGVAWALSAALAVKPNAGLAVLAGIVAALGPARAPRRAWVLWGAAAGMGLLWLVRNMLLMGRPFSPIAGILARRALVYALPRPELWARPPKTFLFVSVALAALVLWAWRNPRWRRPVLAAGLLYGLFLFTPAGTKTEGPRLRVAWRLGLPVLLWTWVLLWAWATEIARRTRRRFPQTPRLGRGGHLALALALSLALLARYGHHLRWEPEHAWLLYDPFPEPVGVGGYWSVFDYIRREVRGAAIDFDHAPPWYVYGAGLGNRPVRPGHYPAGLPAAVPQPRAELTLFCQAAWQPHGRVQDPAAVQAQARAWQAAGRRVLYADAACALAAGPSP